MIFSSIKNFFQIHKRSLFFIVLLFGIFCISADFTFAEEGTGISKEDSDKIIGAINMLLKMSAAVLGVVTSFISIFLYPGWVNGTMFGLQEYLREIWILVSNVVYFLFALILIVIAFMNIIGKGDGTWELKQAMPKFIVGVLIVPFSWFIVQFILSVSAILTVGVLTLPYDSFENHEMFKTVMEDSEIASEEFCKDIVISLTGNFDGVGGKGNTSAVSNGADSEFSENIRCKDGGKVSIKDIMTGEGNAEGIENSIFGVISVYTYGILRVQELDTLNSMDLTTVKGVMDLIFKFLFDALFVVVYMLLMVALFLALLTRGIRLWVFMMLSPVFGLLYFFGKTDGGGKMEKFSPKEFIALAMVPVYAAAALAFGLTFILVATQGVKEYASEDDLDTLKAGGFTLTIIGAHGDGGVEEKSVIGKLIVELFGVAILWIAVMAALGASKTTEAVIQPIAKFGEDVGSLVSKAPTYAPIIPQSLGGSPAGLQALGSSITSGVDSHFRQQGTSRGQEFVEGMTGASNPATSLSNSNMPYRQGVEDGDRSAIQSTMNNLRNQSLETMSEDRELRRAFVEDLERVLGTDGEGEAILSGRNRAAILDAGSEERLSESIARALRESATDLDGGRKGDIESSIGGIALSGLSADQVRRILGGTGQSNNSNDSGNPDSNTENTLNINVNGTDKTIDRAGIDVSALSSGGDVVVTPTVRAELAGVTKEALIRAGYSEEEADGIIAVL